MDRYFAHTAPKQGKGGWETQWEHAECVSDLAAQMGKSLGISAEMSLAGLLHDTGKSSDSFQTVLHGMNSGFDHWTTGALLPWTLKSDDMPECRDAVRFSFYTSLAMRGHHKGLGDGDYDSFTRLRSSIQPFPSDRKLPQEEPAVLLERLLDGRPLPSFAKGEPGTKDFKRNFRYQAAAMLDIRMRLSVLVDADWIATDSHFHRTQGGERIFPPVPPRLQPEQALDLLKAELDRLRMSAGGSALVQEARSQLNESCTRAASMPMGLFTLTSPTGSGKTLAMLRFALEHASLNGLERIIVVLPYLTIIEQSARTYQKLLQSLSSPDNPYLLQDHSLAEAPNEKDEDVDSPRIRPNWAQPLVVTTSVQFFQSLFAADPGSCRKLHSLANSVILFDEAQTLPKKIVVPTLAALSHLCSRYHSSVVFSTATQPAFDEMDSRVKELASGGWKPREIVPASLGLHEKLRRVEVHWPECARVSSGSLAITTRTLQGIADQMMRARRCLCILNTKKQVGSLYKLLTDCGMPVFCITTNLCPKHREDVLRQMGEALGPKKDDPERDKEELRRAYLEGSPCLCVATQCLEAGVDIDFPTVLREWAPLPSLAQAAGRCNRNGLLERGDFHVFMLDESHPPDTAYKQGMSATERLFRVKGGQMDLFDPGLYQEYDHLFFALDEGSVSNDDLVQAVRDRRFDIVAREYKLIDRNTSSVLVPYGLREFESLRDQALKGGIDARWERQARMMAVNIFRPASHSYALDVLVPMSTSKGSRAGESADWFILSDAKYYDPDLGLALPMTQVTMMP